MAEMFPDNLPEDYWDGPGKSAEKKVYDKLKLMSSEWKIVHGCNFYERREIFSTFLEISPGEADFIATHPKYGLIIVEVKGNGKARIQNGSLDPLWAAFPYGHPGAWHGIRYSWPKFS